MLVRKVKPLLGMSFDVFIVKAKNTTRDNEGKTTDLLPPSTGAVIHFQMPTDVGHFNNKIK